MWAAHYLFHVATSGDSTLLALSRFISDLSGVRLAIHSSGYTCHMADDRSLLQTEIFLLDIGLLASLLILYRTAKLVPASEQKQFYVFIPWAIFAVFLFAVGIWTIFQPMQMRGSLSVMGG